MGAEFPSGGASSQAFRDLLQGRVVASCPARSALQLVAPNTIQYGRVQLTALAAMSDIRFEYGGCANADSVPDNEVLVQAALEYGGVIYPMTFNGNQQGTLDRYGWLRSDPAPVDITAGATYYARTRVLAPNNAGNFNPLSGYTPLAADVTAGGSSITTTVLPSVQRNAMRMRIAGASAEVVEVVRWTGTSNPFTGVLRSPLASNHAAAGSVVGQGVWTNRLVYSDQGAGAGNLLTFDIYSGAMSASAPSLTTTIAADAHIGDTTISVTSAATLAGNVFTLDTAGNAETVTARTVTQLTGPFTMYLTAPLAKNHTSGATLAATIAADVVPVPTAISAAYASEMPPCVVLLGDSILNGTGNYVRQVESWGTMALDSTNPVMQLSKNGESALQFVGNVNGTQRRKLFDVGKWLLYAYGTNDLYGASSALQLEANTKTICRWARTRGMKIAMATITPRTTSSDGFKTTGNQTEVNPGTQGVQRKAYNAWIRSGAEGFCDVVLDIADATETARDSGIWVADATTGPYTVDGLHPSSAGHALIAASINPAVFA